MHLRKDTLLFGFVIMLTSIFFSQPCTAFVSQGGPALDHKFAYFTKQGSIDYLSGTSSAIMAFSAIEAEDLSKVKITVGAALKSWETSRRFYVEASAQKDFFKAYETWTKNRARAVLEEFHFSLEHGIGRDIKNKIDEMGPKGLIDMTIESIDNLQKRLNYIMTKYDSYNKPTYEELLDTLNFISDELKKGIIASKIFLVPQK